MTIVGNGSHALNEFVTEYYSKFGFDLYDKSNSGFVIKMNGVDIEIGNGEITNYPSP